MKQSWELNRTHKTNKTYLEQSFNFFLLLNLEVCVSTTDFVKIAFVLKRVKQFF